MPLQIQLSRRLLFQLLVTALLTGRTNCFQLSSIGPQSYTSSGVGTSARCSTTATCAVSKSQSFDLSSGLISQLAVVALKARLTAQTSVECDVTAKSNGLLFGRVGPVTVKGRGWQSSMGLTCRAIEATVEVCELDKIRVVSDRKIVLQQPARGRAMIALDNTDFSNFLAHPLLRPPSISTDTDIDSGNNLQFLRDNVLIDSDSGSVDFDAVFDDTKWRCSLRRGTKGEPRAIVTVTPSDDVLSDDSDADGPDAEALASSLSKEITTYFNAIVFELDGTFLTFRDMMITDKGSNPSVMLKMGIKVKKFPSRNLAF